MTSTGIGCSTTHTKKIPFLCFNTFLLTISESQRIFKHTGDVTQSASKINLKKKSIPQFWPHPIEYVLYIWHSLSLGEGGKCFIHLKIESSTL